MGYGVFMSPANHRNCSMSMLMPLTIRLRKFWEGRLREQNSWGIIFNSARHPVGKCMAAFQPPALSTCRTERHLCDI
jgi:hypothetical protein